MGSNNNTVLSFYIYIYSIVFSMNQNGALLQDIRNIKRNRTLNITLTSKDINSSKDLKKVRSSEQLINLKGLIENKNDKIKNIDQKLEMHQTEIERNAAIIQQLTSTMMNLKDQFVLEKSKVEVEEKKNKQLRDEIQRTNKMLKSKNFKIEQLSKKIDGLEKDLDVFRPYQQKVEELNKANSQIRKEMSKVEDILSEKKQTISELNKEIEKYKEKIQELGSTKSESEKLKNEFKQKSNQVDQLQSQLKHSEQENRHLKQKYEDSVSKSNLTNVEIKQLTDSLKDKENTLNQVRLSERRVKEKVEKLELQNASLRTDSLSKQNFSEALKKQLQDMRIKFDSVNQALLKKSEEDRGQANEIVSMKTKMHDLQKKLEGEITEKNKLKTFEEKYSNICKKSKRMEQLYKLMVPQIQCPYGHELSNPITVIPCGHNYCLGCKKGYTKECMLCSGKLKIEAVYRNELMDDIINIVNGIRQIVEMVK